MELAGVIPPMVTPVRDKSGAINTETVRSTTRFLVDGGVHGLFPAGTIGEFPSLTSDQRFELIETVVKNAGNRPVLAGCGGTSRTRVQSLVDDAAQAGADAAVVVTPYYFDATQEGLCAYYEFLADAASIPIVLYNIPHLTGQRMARESVARLAEHPNIVGLKDSSRNFEYFANVQRFVPDSFAMLQASPELAVPSLDIGADGLVPGPANVLPKTVVDLYEGQRTGERERIFGLLQSILLPIINTTRPFPSPPLYKRLLRRRGYDVGPPLPPLQSLNGTQQEQLDACYDDFIKPALGEPS